MIPRLSITAVVTDDKGDPISDVSFSTVLCSPEHAQTVLLVAFKTVVDFLKSQHEAVDAVGVADPDY